MLSSSPQAGYGKPRTTYSFDLLFPDRTTTFAGEIVLRMDSRLDRPRARMEVRLRQDETILRRDTLQVDFAATAGAWKRPGALYHEFVAPVGTAFASSLHWPLRLWRLRPLVPSPSVGWPLSGYTPQSYRASSSYH